MPNRREAVARCVSRFPLLTLLWSRLLLLDLLDKQVKHLRLDELLDKMSSGLGFDGLVETSLFEHAPLFGAVALHVRGIMADRFHKEMQEGLRHHPVQLFYR